MAKSAVVQVFRASCLEQDWNENQARIGLILTIYGTSLVAQLVESACNVGDLGLIPGLGRSPGEQKGYPLQYSALENSMDCKSPWSPRVGHTERLSLSLLQYMTLSSSA